MRHPSTVPMIRTALRFVVLSLLSVLSPVASDGSEAELERLLDEVLSHHQQGEFSEGIVLAEKHLNLTIRLRGNDHIDTATSLNNLASLNFSQGRYEEAEKLHRRSLEVFEKLLGPDHPTTALALNSLGLVYFSEGRYEDAEPLYRRSLDIQERQPGADDPNMANTLHSLASIYCSQGRYEDAEPLFRRSLEICENQMGYDYPETAHPLNSLGMLYTAQGRYGEAEPLFRRSLDIRERLLGVDHPDTAISLNSLASLFYSQSNYADAEPLYLRILDIRERRLGADHPLTANALHNLGELYRTQGRFGEAEPLHLRSLEIRERQMGADHPDTTTSLNTLALLYQDQGRYVEAEPLFQRGLDACEGKLGDDHPYTATFLHNLASLYIGQGLHDKAAPIVERSMASEASQWRRTLAYFSERECLEFQRTQFPLSGPGNQGSGRLAAEAQLLFKGAVVEAMNTRRVAEDKLVRTDEGKELLRQREALRPRFQKTVISMGADSADSKSLQTQLEDLDKKAVALIGSDGAVNHLSVDLEQVKKSLNETTCLVESFRYDHEVDPKSWEPRYASTIIASSGDPVFLSHGEAKSIEEAVKNYRSALDGKSTGDSPEAFKEAEATLYTRLLAPLEGQLTAGQTVVFSPDAQLHFIPLGLLRSPDGKAFGEKYQVRYVSSGRDLVKEVPQRKTTSLKAFALGNPAYRDNSPMVSLAEAEDAAERSEDKTAIANNLRSGMGQDSGSIQFRPLPGTAREVGSLSTALTDKGYRVTSLNGKEATEEAVKKSMAGYDVIHLATHGFFLNELKITSAEDRILSLSSQDEQRPKGPVQNPMFRSGLALAGAQSTFNLWKSGQVPPPAQDGVLLAAELSGIDLHGTDLVVLSACETAAGESLDGEGVIGLRRALNAAGATNVIMTLWPVDDTATVEVMEMFYEKYLSGDPAAKALAETQRELLPKWVERDGEKKALARLAPFICTSLGSVE